MAALVQRVHHVADTIPKDGSLEETHQLLELRRVLGPRLNEKVIAQLWLTGLVVEMVHCLGKCSLEDPSSMGAARALLNMISNCITHKTQPLDFEHLHLVETILQLCANALIKSSMDDKQAGQQDWSDVQMKEDLILFVEVSLDTMRRIAELHAPIAASLLKNEHLHLLLTSDDVHISRASLLVIHSIAGSWEALIKQLDIDIVAEFAENCCFHLLEATDAFDAQHSADLLLAIFLAVPTVIEKLRQFRGVSTEIASKWSNEAFLPKVQEIAELFESDTRFIENKEANRIRTHAVMKIQSTWRGFVCRRHLSNKEHAVGVIQRAWKESKKTKLAAMGAEKKAEAEKLAQLEVQRESRIQTKIAEMKEFAEVSAMNVTDYLKNRQVENNRETLRLQRLKEQEISAPTIKERARRDASAKLIQTKYREYRKRKHSTPPRHARAASLIPKTISEPRRELILKKIKERWSDTTSTTNASDLDEVGKLYSETQQRLGELKVDRFKQEWLARHRVQTMNSIEAIQCKYQDRLSTLTRNPTTLGDPSDRWATQPFTESIRIEAARNHRQKLLELATPNWQRSYKSLDHP